MDENTIAELLVRARDGALEIDFIPHQGVPSIAAIEIEAIGS